MISKRLCSLIVTCSLKKYLCKKTERLSAILCILALGFSLFSNPVTIESKRKSYKETRITLPKGHGSLDVGGLFVNAKGQIRVSSREWEQTVYGIYGNKLKKVSDPMVKAAYNAWDYVKDKEKDTDFFSNTVNKKGTAGYFTNGSIIFQYNKKGKIQKTFHLLKNKELAKLANTISKIKWVSQNKVAVGISTWSGGMVVLADMEKRKITKKYSKKYTSLCGTDGKHIYVTSGSISDKTEEIVKMKALSGKKISSISTQKIRTLAENRTEKMEGGGLYRDEPFDTCYSGGKLYLKYLTGIYTWNEKKKRLDTVMDGIGNKKYKAGQLISEYGISLFEVIGRKIYVADDTKIYRYSLS